MLGQGGIAAIGRSEDERVTETKKEMALMPSPTS